MVFCCIFYKNVLILARYRSDSFLEFSSIVGRVEQMTLVQLCGDSSQSAECAAAHLTSKINPFLADFKSIEKDFDLFKKDIADLRAIESASNSTETDAWFAASHFAEASLSPMMQGEILRDRFIKETYSDSVSYTHLTLPTNREV